jgi:hypothetical protein
LALANTPISDAGLVHLKSFQGWPHQGGTRAPN